MPVQILNRSSLSLGLDMVTVKGTLQSGDVSSSWYLDGGWWVSREVNTLSHRDLEWFGPCHTPKFQIFECD
jgi:hypothetical protein